MGTFYRIGPAAASRSRPAEIVASRRRVTRAASRLIGRVAGLRDGGEDRPPDTTDLETLVALAEEASDWLASALASGDLDPGEETIGLLVRLRDVRGSLRRQHLQERLAGFERVERALDRLREHDAPADLLRDLPQSLCTGLGFARGIISRISGSEWTVEGAWFSDGKAAETAYLEGVVGRTLAIDRGTPETEVVRRRAAVLVGDEDATRSPAGPAPADTRSYVLAPIVDDDRVVAVLHADYGPGGRSVEAHDRTMLEAFSRGVAHIYRHAVLATRMNRQHAQTKRMVSSTEALLDDLARADITLHDGLEPDDPMARSATAVFVPPQTRIESILTKRELEVLALMAAGDSNSTVAQKLYIAEGTVKSHVKHILRKLRASNRAEAVARYLTSQRGH